MADEKSPNIRFYTTLTKNIQFNPKNTCMKPSACLVLSYVCQEHKDTVDPVTHGLKLCSSIYMWSFSVNTVHVFSFYRSLSQLNVGGNLYLIRDHNMWNQKNQSCSSDSIQTVLALKSPDQGSNPCPMKCTGSTES